MTRHDEDLGLSIFGTCLGVIAVAGCIAVAARLLGWL